MATRELVAGTLGPLVVATILWLPPWAFLTLLAAAVVTAGHEALTMARRANIPCQRWLPLTALLATMVACWWFRETGLIVATMAVLLILPAAQLAHPERPRGGFSAAALSCFVVLYLGLTSACVGWLRLLPEGSLGISLLLFLFLTVWIGDSGAYYLGKRFGHHRMAPTISPKKTWEGLAGGTAATIGTAALCKPLLGLPFSWGQLLAMAAVLAVAAPVGDLIESLFKRDTGVKDSSTLLLGHGGFLDRTDSLLYAAPPLLAYLLLAGLIG